MELIQIGAPQTQITIREMFEQLAQREAMMVRAARERMASKCPSSADGMNEH